MVGFYKMVTQDFNVRTKRVQVPSHKSMSLVHNSHFTINVSVAQAIDASIDGYQSDDWINDEQRDKAIATDNHWMIMVFPKTSKKYFVYSASDIDVLLEYVSKLSHWKDGEP